MTEAVIQLIAHAPAAGAVIFVVVVFLRHMRASEISREEDQARCHSVHEATTNKMAGALDRNSEAFNKCSVHLEQSSARLEQTVKALDNSQCHPNKQNSLE